MRFIDQFKVIILDMGHTFMFEVDKFGNDQNYYQTYRNVGGSSLQPDEVQFHMQNFFQKLHSAYQSPQCYKNFGSIDRFLDDYISESSLPSQEKERILKVFAEHERGKIPQSYANAIHRLHQTHTLAIISNIWSHKSAFEPILKKEGLFELFEEIIWSSQTPYIKPAPELFEMALEKLKMQPQQTLYVGDNPKRDIVGATSVGMPVVYIENKRRPLGPDHPRPTRIISDLTQLDSLLI